MLPKLGVSFKECCKDSAIPNSKACYMSQWLVDSKLGRVSKGFVRRV